MNATQPVAWLHRWDDGTSFLGVDPLDNPHPKCKNIGLYPEELIFQLKAEMDFLKFNKEACATLNYNKGHEAGRNLMSTFTERQWKIIKFALFVFASYARHSANAAAQDLTNKIFKDHAAECFLKDAKEAEELLSILRKGDEK
ncbi:hypothetical protein [Polynucleobacter sp. AP-RePozz3-80-G7]|uniref:hypothetical protein n=1 Tax=Polynucleobacter sp. AP-RePozz3-80-G7 TaxID=2689105 RepID=UPI001C0C22D4|nr:hypothetical protein [Polynucleobacter sp. AP-RePozz3-80-G7]MBU3639980.1 hypothetical protein [Polynucleobacter sp. AP-RePozz3-80-G7]